mmetsp:Transcript_28656/g.50980  ORF Transcript_28656/g.50980 Transcript_28656/m.50980 type:complete len:424 (+) Transcript_28656:273-1544(+)
MPGSSANPLGQFNQLKLIQSLFFVPQADLSITRTLLEKLPNRWNDYPEMLCWSIIGEKPTFVEFFLSEGVNLDYPPDNLSAGGVGIPKHIEDALKSYRKTPYVILAAGVGDKTILQQLFHAGRSIHEKGHIGYSRLKSNSVIGNVLSAAVYNDRTALANWLLETFPASELEIEAVVTEDRAKGGRGGVNKEVTGCTPLLLAVQRSSLETIRKLIEFGALVTATDWSKNTVLHLAVLMQRAEVVKELIDLPGVDVQARNNKGETPLTIAKDKALSDIEALLSEKIQDTSEQIAEELINELLEEENKKSKKKQRRLYENRDSPKQPAASSSSRKKSKKKDPVQSPSINEEAKVEEVSAPEKDLAYQMPEGSELKQDDSGSNEVQRILHILTGRTDVSHMTQAELSTLEIQLQGALAEVRKALSKS